MSCCVNGCQFPLASPEWRAPSAERPLQRPSNSKGEAVAVGRSNDLENSQCFTLLFISIAQYEGTRGKHGKVVPILSKELAITTTKTTFLASRQMY